MKLKTYTSMLVLLFISILAFAGKAAAQTYNVPEILYYKFNEGPTSATNYAAPGAGTGPGIITGIPTGPPGQFGLSDTALRGNGGTSTANNVNTNWNVDVTGSWTISFWTALYNTSFTGYFFGSPTTSFRCFTNGAAGTGNVRLSGTGITNVTVTGALPGPSVIHLVYDSAAGNIKAYLNGALQVTVPQSAFTIVATGPFRVAAWTAGSSIAQGSLMDEFRFYRRALDTTEIRNTWNQPLPYTLTTVQNISNTAETYSLSQNYPNPFNPATTLGFSVPKSGNVKLTVYNSLGKEVRTLVNQNLSTGSYSVNFDGTGLASGIYFYRLEAGEYIETKKMNLIK